MAMVPVRYLLVLLLLACLHATMHALPMGMQVLYTSTITRGENFNVLVDARDAPTQPSTFKLDLSNGAASVCGTTNGELTEAGPNLYLRAPLFYRNVR